WDANASRAHSRKLPARSRMAVPATSRRSILPLPVGGGPGSNIKGRVEQLSGILGYAARANAASPHAGSFSPHGYVALRMPPITYSSCASVGRSLPVVRQYFLAIDHVRQLTG